MELCFTLVPEMIEPRNPYLKLLNIWVKICLLPFEWFHRYFVMVMQTWPMLRWHYDRMAFRHRVRVVL